MIESNSPEIDVDELMQKIREEVAKRKSHSQITTLVPETAKSELIEIISCIEGHIKDAEFRASVRTKWPDKLNRFPYNLSKPFKFLALKLLNGLFKDQREVNLNLINSLKQSVFLNQQLIKEIAMVRSQLYEKLREINHLTQGIDERLETTTHQVQGIDERLETATHQVQGIDERLATIDSCLKQSTYQVQGIDERLETTIHQVQGIDERLETATHQVQGIDERLETATYQVQGIDERLEATTHQAQGMHSYLKEMDERHLSNDSYLKNDLGQQKRLINMFLEEAWKRLPEPFSQEQLQTFVNEEQHSLDAFYVAFEDRFRGSREDIRNRLRVYLPLIEEAKVGTPYTLILDVGCGRGEWLELLKESGYAARGLDINRVMIEQCQARRLEVVESDVITYLKSLPDASLGAVTGFHIIEHLPFEILIELFDETVRVLRPGGLVIFETPNPENLLVGSHTFYLDPTHRNPLPSPTIKFVAESRGLERVQIMNLHPYPEQFKVSGSEVAKRFNEYFYEAQDYAVIGYKNKSNDD